MAKNLEIVLKIIVLLFLLIHSETPCQSPQCMFDTIGEAGEQHPAYYLFHNPAFLNYDADEELLYIRSTYNSTSGDFKPFIAAGQVEYSRLGVSGKKRIGDSQIFRGSFGFQQLVRDDWNWLATKDARFGMPFLLGDSTSGKTRYNGIAMTAEYWRRLCTRFNVGVSLAYYVDEGLKQVSPKPTSKHRDIAFSTGFGYLLASNLTAGAVFQINDNIEEIYYREDKAALYQETHLYKFRGYDLPLEFNKKTESRNACFDEYAAHGSLTYKGAHGNSIAIHAGSGVQQVDIHDNLNVPQPEGYWQNRIYESGFQAYWGLLRGISMGLKYRYFSESMWARQPLFDVVISETDIPSSDYAAGIDCELNSKMRLSCEGGLVVSKIDYRDYYSQIDWRADRRKWQTRFGIDIRWRDGLQSFLSYGFGKMNVSDESVSRQMITPVSVLRSKDITYYLTDSVGHRINLMISVRTASLGTFRLHATYRTVQPQHSDIFRDTFRQELFMTLELLARVF
ncbi:hypothetical protein JXJ21_13905 [candidate division KSB1 bacterium]|nr:hypothetical protein [candidate division KSB1 bacterium]